MHTSIRAFFAASNETGSALSVGDTVAPVAADPIVTAPATVSEQIKPRTEKRKLTAAEIAERKNGSAQQAKPAAKPAKQSKPVANATPADADKRFETAQRISADRSAIKALYAAFEANRVSVPVKTLAAFKPETSTAHPITRKPSVRQAAAIAAAFAGSNVKLAAGASVPRVFENANGLRACIENGVMRDAISSGLITVSGSSPETEKLKLTKSGFVSVTGLLGQRTLKAANLI